MTELRMPTGSSGPAPVDLHPSDPATPPSTALVSFEGELGIRSAFELRNEIDDVIGRGAGTLVIDLSRAAFVDSVALGTFIHARNRCLDAGVSLRLRGASDSTKRLLALSGIADLFEHEVDLAGLRATLPAVLPEHTLLPPLPDPKLDQLAALARRSLDVPVVLVSLVDQERQVFPGSVGLAEPWQARRTTPLTHSLCKYVVAGRQPLIITDVRLDPVLCESLSIPDLGVVAYAGVPVLDSRGDVIGSLCAIDTRPREWNALDVAMLTDLASVCSAELQRREARRRRFVNAERDRIAVALSDHVVSDLLSLSLQLSTARTSTANAETARHLEAAMATVDSVLARVRQAVFPQP